MAFDKGDLDIRYFDIILANMFHLEIEIGMSYFEIIDVYSSLYFP